MKFKFSHKFLTRFLAIHMMVFVLGASFPLGALADTIVTTDIKANGSDGPITITDGDSYSYNWTSSNASSCQVTSPANSGIPISGSDTVSPGSPFYPTIGAPMIITIVCTDGLTTATDAVTINLASLPPPPPPAPTVDIKANGSDGPITITAGDSYTYSWTSTNSTSCQITSPLNTGVSTSGSNIILSGDLSYYPTASVPTIITIVCTDGSTTATDAVTINLAGSIPPPPPATSTPVTVTLTSNPASVLANATSTLTWSSIGATSCSAPWTALTTTSGTQIVIVATTTTYTINCTNGVNSNSANAIVTVTAPIVPPGGGGGGGGGSCTLPTISSSLAVNAVINDVFSYTITTTSTSTPTLTVATSSLPTGLSFATSTGVISGTPTQLGTFNIAITSSNPCGNDAQTLVITVSMPPVTPSGGGGGGGGGGSSSGGHRHDIPPVISNGLECFYLHDYMRRDFNNDPEQVMRLQAFLKAFEGYDYVTINGVFDQATFDAVSAFQMKYESDILTPWGHTAPTGYVYILTLKKINEIYCQRVFPVNESQAREIVAFKALLESLQNQGYPVQFTPEGTIILPPAGTGTSTDIELPIVGQNSPPQGQILNNLATAVFSTPVGFTNILRCLYELLLILIVLYILVNVLEDVLYKKIEDVRRRFVAKWTTICLGLFIAIVLAYIWGLWCLILPLLIALLISLAWMFIYPVHDKIKTSVKSWYLVISARIKSRNLPKN